MNMGARVSIITCAELGDYSAARARLAGLDWFTFLPFFSGASAEGH